MIHMKTISALCAALLLALPAAEAPAAVIDQARLLRAEAQHELCNGDVVEGQQKMLRALDLFRQAGNSDQSQSVCLYLLSISHFNQRNLAAMAVHLKSMRELARRNPDNKFVNYDYLSVLAAYIPQIPAPVVDGIFGSATREAVLAAQGYFGLPQTGIVNFDTWDAIYDQFSDTLPTDLIEQVQEFLAAK